MSLIKDLRAALNAHVKEKSSKPERYEFGSLDYTIPQIPCIIEKRQDPWVWYGEDNLYPLRVSDLKNGSGIHNSIIKTKTKMTAGDGFLINGALTPEESEAKLLSLPLEVQDAYKFFLDNPNGKENLESIVDKMADDLQTHGALSYETVRNTDFTKIVTTKYVNVENLRSGKLEDDEVKSYWYSRDWKHYRKTEYKPKEIKAFDLEDKENYNQIIYEKMGKQDYYGELPYKGCLTWVLVDFKMGIFHLSNIDNGMNPGIWFKFYKLPGSEAKKQEVLADLKKTYQGATNTNKMMVTFSEGKELGPDIMPVQASNLDKMLLNLSELCDKKILTGHQLTSPLLAGVSVSGQLGGNTELKTAYLIFDNTGIEADRKIISRSLQKILDFNKIPIQIEINPFDPFKQRKTTTPSTTV